MKSYRVVIEWEGVEFEVPVRFTSLIDATQFVGDLRRNKYQTKISKEQESGGQDSSDD